ncbi:MAG: helix-turn-helix domain-containing protein [Ferrovum sp.]|jgi:DNA-binding Xre family transcriptional regulator|nr:helix-turn-helix domain-containing protein [Ferrovum sp.]NDU89618.1 helix-turn-helix transcriptional regulator [Ferrovum sp.]
MEAKLKKRLSWRLRVMLAERNITTATELKRRLESYGYEITSSQLTRIIRERPERISTDLLDHLLAILRCEVTDLLRLDPIEQDQGDDGQPAFVVEKLEQPQKKRIRRVPDSEDESGDLTGPKITPFPIPPRK